MNVKEMIKLLSDNVDKADREKAAIEIWCGKQQYEIESMNGFAISPDISIIIKPIQMPIIQPFKYKSKHNAMVKKQTAKIIKGLS
jgi:hypothetical protein